MANEYRKISLTQLGGNSGPYYKVEYSTDCVSYTQSYDCMNSYLPSVGSYTYCTVDSATQCIKLTSLNDVCGNSVVENLNPTTTTTIPPQSTTTTLGNTTTTVSPQSTTTTLSGNTTTTQAIKYTYLRYDVNTNTCTTSNPIPLWSYLNFTSGFYKIESDPTLYYLEVSPHTDYTFQFLSATLDSCTPATTTTNAPENPTTTTLSPTTSTPSPIWYSLSPCDNPSETGNYSNQMASGTFQIGDIVIYGGTRYFTVTQFNYSNPGGTQWSVTATGLTSCPATTTTLSPTTTLATLTVTNGSVTCSGTTGGWRSSFSGGSGTYTNVAYGTSQANAIDWLDGTGSGPGVMHTLMLGETYYDWTNVSNGTWYVALKDSNGTITVQNTAVVVNCTIPTTTTLSPTTTVAPATATLDWQFSETNTSGTMYLYINGSIVETRTSDANGTYNVSVGDTINYELLASGCAQKANVYSQGIIVDAACDNGSVSLVSAAYTVTSGDIGNTILLDMFASCDTACV